jgi:hypothetical protein
MNPNAPDDDQTFSRFWRQMLRWITSDVPERVVVSLPTDQVNPKNPVAIRATVADSMYLPRNDAKVIAHLTSDNGVKRGLTLDWAIDRDGEYRGTFTPDQPGVYTVKVEASFPSGAVVGDTSYVRVANLNLEYFDAKEMRAPLLKRIASETGGRYYRRRPTRSPRMWRASTATVVNQMDLWDMPAVLLLLVALVTPGVIAKLRGCGARARLCHPERSGDYCATELPRPRRLSRNRARPLATLLG